jgi:ubiquitin C-terminal hydrolase
MNSVIQQFFMIPLFKNGILSLPIDPSLKEEDDNDILLFQLQKMFHYLKYSKKEHYNPKSFVYSFKDFEGNPTNISIQCDAQEFLSRFIEKIEESLKNSPQKYLCDNIVGGSTLQQVKCTNPECGNISERRENINFLSLDIKGCTNVNECLAKFILEEKIEDYHCEKCDKKITNLKRVLVDKIPNILIIHLQRIAFSYETFTMEKINIPIEFNKNLNIKNYTLNKDNNDIPSEYYDYELQGIIIHKGTAQFGHYYSIIYSEEKDLSGKWYKFNDTSVTEVNYDQILSDAIGSSFSEYDSSAYMLIYQKKNKKPVIINCKEINENKKKY